MPAIILLPAISFLTTHPVSPNAPCQTGVLILAQVLRISSFHQSSPLSPHSLEE